MTAWSPGDLVLLFERGARAGHRRVGEVYPDGRFKLFADPEDRVFNPAGRDRAETAGAPIRSSLAYRVAE